MVVKGKRKEKKKKKKKKIKSFFYSYQILAEDFCSIFFFFFLATERVRWGERRGKMEGEMVSISGEVRRKEELEA